jgi:transposase
MTPPGRYPQDLRERAVRMVFEHRGDHDSEWAAITSIASKMPGPGCGQVRACSG